MSKLRTTILTIGASAALLVASAQHAAAGEPRTVARQAFMVALPSNKVLLAKRADTPMAPSSMVKLMTVLLVIEALKAGKLTFDQKVKISRTAVKTRGSRIGLRAGETVPLELLLEGTIVASGNDSARALAEVVAGSEAAFAKRMTARATALGLKNSSFRNATGFTVRGQHMTARDVATLSSYLIRNHPLLYGYFSLKSVTHNGKTYRSRNPVLGVVDGADGLKTGQTRAGGYGLAASAARGGTRLILVINGLKTAKARKAEALRLLEWGFKQAAGAGK